MILRLLIYSLLLATPLLGQKVPKLDRVFKETQLLTKTKKDGKTTYFYGTDSTFVELKKQMVKTLGEGWVEVKAKTIKQDKKNLESVKARKAMGESIAFTHPKQPTLRVTMNIFNNAAMGKTRTLLVTEFRVKK